MVCTDMGTILCIRGRINNQYSIVSTDDINRVTFADIPLEVSFGPIKLKLDNDTHRPSLDKENVDDSVDQIELETKPPVADEDTISDITKKLSDIISIMEYKGQQIDGLLR